MPPEDFAIVDLKPWNESGKTYVELILPILKRIMGILLQHKGDGTISCDIFSHPYYVKLFPNEKVVGEYPAGNCTHGLLNSSLQLIIFSIILVQVPDLNELIFKTNDNDNDLTDKKWQLLFWTLGIEFDEQKYQEFQNGSINFNFSAKGANCSLFDFLLRKVTTLFYLIFRSNRFLRLKLIPFL